MEAPWGHPLICGLFGLSQSWPFETRHNKFREELTKNLKSLCLKTWHHHLLYSGPNSKPIQTSNLEYAYWVYGGGELFSQTSVQSDCLKSHSSDFYIRKETYWIHFQTFIWVCGATCLPTYFRFSLQLTHQMSSLFFCFFKVSNCYLCIFYYYNVPFNCSKCRFSLFPLQTYQKTD